jgi:hypothetical protein
MVSSEETGTSPAATSKVAKPRRSKRDASPPSLIQVAFPQAANIVFFAALFVGIGLIVLPTAFAEHFALNGVQANLVICIGSALVLAAFGGQATVRLGGAIMVGVAAIAIGLFVYLQDRSSGAYLTGTIRRVDRDRFTDIEMSNHNRILGVVVPGRQAKNSTFDFAVFQDELTESEIEISLVDKEQPTFEYVARVKVSDIGWAFDRHQRVEWELREDGNGVRIYDTATRKIISLP